MHNLEARFPLLGDNVGAVLFWDFGNVYSEFSKISFRVTQRDLADFDYAVQAVGLGFRLRTPVGPIRLDLSYGLNSPRFFGYQGSLEDLIAGRGRQVVQRIHPFQFHFSLGQTF
jgi:outer membrane translocation and assembly module TamA